jgi:hypothetical protein
VIEVGARDNAVQVPRAAVRDGVCVGRRERRVKRRPVQVGLTAVDRVEIVPRA